VGLAGEFFPWVKAAPLWRWPQSSTVAVRHMWNFTSIAPYVFVQVMDTYGDFTAQLTLNLSSRQNCVVAQERGHTAYWMEGCICHRNGLDNLEANNVSFSFLELSHDYLLYNPLSSHYMVRYILPLFVLI
jgi:hypothetical protein